MGVLIGVPIANANAEGGLEGVATSLLILFLSLCVCTAVGAALALGVSKQHRPIVTGLITVPVMFAATYVAALIATRAADTPILLVPAIIVGSIGALLASRALAMIGNKAGS